MSENIQSGNALGLIEFLDNLVEKGRAPAGSISPLKTAIIQILSTVDGKDDWQKVEVTSIDIVDYVNRFGVLTNGRYTAGSLTTYKSRLTKASNWYKNFLTQPGWTPPKETFRQPKADVKPDVGIKSLELVKEPLTQKQSTSNLSEQSDLIAYPFPLRANKIVRLFPPYDLKLSEAKRLGKYLESLSIDEAI